LSWLIGGSLQEVLTSIIFLFVKHPFDVGDRVNLEKDSYTVKEIRLLSTIFLDSSGTLVQAPNTGLNKMVCYMPQLRFMVHADGCLPSVHSKHSPESPGMSINI
jgi:hypothetical protein